MARTDDTRGLRFIRRKNHGQTPRPHQCADCGEVITGSRARRCDEHQRARRALRMKAWRAGISVREI